MIEKEISEGEIQINHSFHERINPRTMEGHKLSQFSKNGLFKTLVVNNNASLCAENFFQFFNERFSWISISWGNERKVFWFLALLVNDVKGKLKRYLLIGLKPIV